MDDILRRLESFNEYGQTSDSRQVMKDAAAEIRRLSDELQLEQRKNTNLEAMLMRKASNKMARSA
jgi:hypothetical protein